MEGRQRHIRGEIATNPTVRPLPAANISLTEAQGHGEGQWERNSVAPWLRERQTYLPSDR